MNYNGEQVIVEAVKRELANMTVPLTAGGIFLGKRCGERLLALVAEGAPGDAAQLPAAFVRAVSDETEPDSRTGGNENLRVEVHLVVGALSAGDRGALMFLRNMVFEAFDGKCGMGGIAGHYITAVRRGDIVSADGARPGLTSVVTLEVGLFQIG